MSLDYQILMACDMFHHFGLLVPLLLSRFLLLRSVKLGQVKRHLVPQPRRPGSVVSELVSPVRPGLICVRMDQYRQLAAMNDEPRDEGAELCRREEVHLEHRVRVWADRLLPEPVNA